MFFSDWGLIPYAEAWQRQTEWFDSLIQAKQNNDVLSFVNIRMCIR